MNHFQLSIAALYPAANVRHVEAWLRLEYGTLDSLDFTPTFLAPFVEMADTYPRDSEQLARSYSL